MTTMRTPRAARVDVTERVTAGLGVYKRLLGSVRRQWGAQDAEDVVQDAYLRLVVANGREKVRDADSFLRTAAVNLIRDRARAAAVRRAVAGDMNEDAACTRPDAARTLSDRQQLAVLERALAELSAERRAALVLRRFDEKSHAAIAKSLGLSVSMVEKHIRAALDHCRRRLAEANGDA